MLTNPLLSRYNLFLYYRPCKNSRSFLNTITYIITKTIKGNLKMKNKILVVNSAVLALSASSFCSDIKPVAEFFPASMSRGTLNIPVQELSCQDMSYGDRQAFADLAYKANKASDVRMAMEKLIQEGKSENDLTQKQKDDKKIYDDLIAYYTQDGWSIQELLGTTGWGTNKVSSIMGIMAFRDKQVVVATRGTEKSNVNDWQTNFDITKVDAQPILGIKGRVHRGFLETHTSIYDGVKDGLENYADLLNCTIADLQIDTTGHSLGGAQQDLMLVHLLTDSSLGLGRVNSDNNPNAGRVKGLAIAAPDVFSQSTIGEVATVIGEGNVEHIKVAGDIVPRIYGLIGFGKLDDSVRIDTGQIGINAHIMKDDVKTAIKNLDTKTSAETKETIRSFGRKIADSVHSTGKAVKTAVSTVKTTARSAWNFVTSIFG